MYKIVLTGPESTGKTTLAQQLADYYQTNWVEEYARTYIDGLNRAYEEADLLEMAKGQLQMEEKGLLTAQDFLFIDTDLITFKIWAKYRYGRCDAWILEQIEERFYDLYILCATDVLWEDDPQRENPDNREALFGLYVKELELYEKRFLVVKGGEKSRLAAVINHLNKHFMGTK